MPPEIPEKVRRLAALTDDGRAWLDRLPDQIAGIERAWDLRVGEPLRKGSEAYVAHARLADGAEAVLKIVIAGRDPSRQELRILQMAGGRGYARLLRGDAEANVLLIERLGPQLAELGLAKRDELAAICTTLREAWPPSPGGPFATAPEMAQQMAETIEELSARLGWPCAERTVRQALDFAERRRRAFDPATAVLAHGDAHQWNTLLAPSGGFRLVDPDGVLAEPAFDLAISMREWETGLPTGDLRAAGRERLATLCELTGLEPQPIWEWGLLQLVWNGLLLSEIGAEAPAMVSFAMADAWVD
ncbi:MAG: aminoglycoside phosphotransferase family protein [Phenylobacterium sp.]